jgi:hypothetical protein
MYFFKVTNWSFSLWFSRNVYFWYFGLFFYFFFYLFILFIIIIIFWYNFAFFLLILFLKFRPINFFESSSTFNLVLIKPRVCFLWWSIHLTFYNTKIGFFFCLKFEILVIFINLNTLTWTIAFSDMGFV